MRLQSASQQTGRGSGRRRGRVTRRAAIQSRGTRPRPARARARAGRAGAGGRVPCASPMQGPPHAIAAAPLQSGWASRARRRAWGHLGRWSRAQRIRARSAASGEPRRRPARRAGAARQRGARRRPAAPGTPRGRPRPACAAPWRAPLAAAGAGPTRAPCWRCTSRCATPASASAAPTSTCSSARSRRRASSPHALPLALPISPYPTLISQARAALLAWRHAASRRACACRHVICLARALVATQSCPHPPCSNREVAAQRRSSCF